MWKILFLQPLVDMLPMVFSQLLLYFALTVGEDLWTWATRDFREGERRL